MKTKSKTRITADDRVDKYCTKCGKKSYTFAKKCICGGAFVPEDSGGKPENLRTLREKSDITIADMKNKIIEILNNMRNKEHLIEYWEVPFLKVLSTQESKIITKGTELKLNELYRKYVH